MNQFKSAWNFYLNHWQYFALLAAPVLAIEVVTAQLIAPLGSDAMFEDLADFADSNGIYTAILGLLGIIASVSFVGGLIAAFDSKTSGYSLDPMAALFIGFKKGFPIFGAYILCAIAVFFGLLLLILPGIYVGARLALFPSYMMMENKGVFDSLKSSWEATDEHGGTLFGLTLLFIVIMLIPSSIFTSMLDPGFTQIMILGIFEYVIVIPWSYMYFSLYQSQKNL
ncbi:MAG: hypothetical protein EBW62_03225 [Proteobacteria bacterium]|nr:hypothetical protein [Pseudomonadota bacterium]